MYSFVPPALSQSFTGWGTFPIPVTLFFKANLGLPEQLYQHLLVFDGDGAAKTYTILVNKQAIKQN